jgi:hypothetical protein
LKMFEALFIANVSHFKASYTDGLQDDEHRKSLFLGVPFNKSPAVKSLAERA